MISEDLRSALEEIAGSGVLVVAADFDGTLSPLIDDPSRAVPDETALQQLVAVSAMPTVRTVIVSGRTHDVLAQLTGAPRGMALIGDHGAHHADDGTEIAEEELDRLESALRVVASRHPGAIVERKTHGVAFHYRNVPDGEAAAEDAHRVARDWGGRIIDGKKVVEIILAEGDKGSAIEAFRRQCGADAVVFFGDDTTDEDVFRTLGNADVGVKVGPGETAAVYRVDDPGDVAACLGVLLEAVRTLSG